MKRYLLAMALMASTLMGWALEVECTPGNLASLIDDTSITSLTITGEMDARDFKFITDSLDALTTVNLSGVTIVAYSDHNKPLFNNEINHPANCIPAMAFFGKKISQITLPASTKGIGMAAFAGCSNITSFNFPAAIDSIAAYAFSATKLSQLNLPVTVKAMGEGAFSKITTLTSATINPTSPMAIAKCAFEGCTNLTSVTLGPNVKTIGDRAFKLAKKHSWAQRSATSTLSRLPHSTVLTIGPSHSLSRRVPLSQPQPQFWAKVLSTMPIS